MTFAQALARIEALLNKDVQDWDTIGDLLDKHAESIVQLGKVAAEMRTDLANANDVLFNINLGEQVASQAGRISYDKLMKGDK